MSPARSKKQQQWAGAELARRRSGKAPKSDISTESLTEFAETKHKGLPTKVKGKKGSKAPY
jgi:hypothetical protein